MSEQFSIQATNADGLPVTNPQETRSEAGYLKDLTIEGVLTLLASGSIIVGSTNKIWINDTADGALNIGGATKASAPFRVTSAGVLTATNATITGTIKGSGNQYFEITPDAFRGFGYNGVGMVTYPMFEITTNVVGGGAGKILEMDSQDSTNWLFTVGGVLVTALTSLLIEHGKPVSITDATDSTSTTDGSFYTAGGVGIAKSAYVGTNLRVLGTTEATNVATGSTVLSGGLGVEKSAHIGNSLHTGGLNIKGIYLLDTSVNANYTVTANISYVRVDDSGAIGAGVTLPAATGTGKIITIKDVGGSAASIPISISRTGSDTIDDLTSTIISTNYGVLRVIDGASGRWDII
jgi:hypothetical protein